MPVNLNKYAAEVQAALPNESKEMDLARERQDFYDYKGAQYEKYFRRDAETAFDFQGRSKRQSGFLRECIDKLCSHLYAPGPARRWVGQETSTEDAEPTETPGAEFLGRVWQDNQIDSIMLECEKLSTLNNVCAIQIDAGTEYDDQGNRVSNFEEKPICYRVWGREQFCVWTDPDSAAEVEVVCTKDMYDTQKRYRLWSDTEVWTFLTKKQEPGLAGGQATSGGRVAYPTTPRPVPHDYGCLPFSFIHYELPLRDFEVVASGDFLWKAEICIDDRLMRMDEAISKHLAPIAWAKGVPPAWKMHVMPGRFIQLPSREPVMTDQGVQEAGDSDIGYLEAHVDVASSWDDLERYIKQCLEAVGIPENAVKMQPIAATSGIALIVEQEPLLKRAERRRAMFKVYEDDLSKRTLICAGNHYGKPEFVAETNQGHLAASWPSPRLAVQTQDMLDLEISKVSNGLQSHLMMLQNVNGCTRDEAIELIKQITLDQDETAGLYPEAVATTAPTDPEAQRQHELAMISAKQGNGVAP
jgi:hypothetical protein